MRDKKSLRSEGTLAPLLVSVALLFLARPASARPLEEIKKEGTIRVATEGTFAPFNFYQGKKLTGFEIDLVNEIARRLGVQVAWRTLSFDSLLIGLNEDRYDLVAASHAVTEERSKAVDFITPHYCSGAVIVSAGGRIRSLRDLEGKIAAAQVSSIYPAFLAKVPGIKEIKTLPKDADTIQAVALGRADAAVTDRFAAFEILKAQKNTKLGLGDVINPEKNAMAASKGNKSLRDAVENALLELMRNGTYEKISRKYFGEDIRCR